MERRVAEALGIDEAASVPIDRWLSHLREWNARIDLTAARTDDELHDPNPK